MPHTTRTCKKDSGVDLPTVSSHGLLLQGHEIQHQPAIQVDLIDHAPYASRRSFETQSPKLTIISKYLHHLSSHPSKSVTMISFTCISSCYKPSHCTRLQGESASAINIIYYIHIFACSKYIYNEIISFNIIPREGHRY